MGFLDKLLGRSKDAAHDAGDMAKDAGDKGMDMAKDAGDKVGDVSDDAKSHVTGGSDTTEAERLDDVPDQAAGDEGRAP
jgi:ribosomal protein S6E (S10)